nr:polypeptide N acetylgalactosaminyltransferase 14 [Hymenolepis microstoma]
MSRIITEACSNVHLAENPIKFCFPSEGETKRSVHFVLLNMRYFVSASFGKFLTPDVPIISESADRTQATISTACTSWLSSIGAGGIADLCEVILDKLLPTALAFVMSSDRDISNPFDDVVLALFRPLMTFFSGELVNGVEQTPGFALQIVDIMVGEEDFTNSETVQKHIEKISLCISDILVLRTLCEILCAALQDTNLTAMNGRFITSSDYLDEVILQLTQSGKQFDSIIRQLGDRIAEVAIGHSKFFCLDATSKRSFDELLEALTTEDYGPSTLNIEKAQDELSLEKWNCFMDEIWTTLCSAVPAGLARQIYARIVSEVLKFVVQKAANQNLSTDDDISNMTAFIWDALKRTHKLIFRCADSESEILSQGLLSNDLQNIHCSAMMLAQCLIAIGSPNDIINRLHGEGFYSGLENGAFSVPFNSNNWLKIVDPKRFYIPSTESQDNSYFDPLSALIIIFYNNGELLKPLLLCTSWKDAGPSDVNRRSIFNLYKSCYEIFATAEFGNNCFTNILTSLFESVSDIRILGVEHELPEPVWIEALFEFIGNRMISIIQKICDLAFDRVLITEIREDFVGGLSSVTSKEPDLCSISPDSTLRIKEIVNGIYSSALECLPPRLLTFFNQRDVTLKRTNETFSSIGGSLAIQIILKSLKKQKLIVPERTLEILSNFRYTKKEALVKRTTQPKEGDLNLLNNFAQFNIQISPLSLATDLPPSSVSVIFVAHNEKEIILNNTIRSLLENTPHSLLKEIIVVDDHSNPKIDFKSSTFDVQVTLIRNRERQGLIRSRLIGVNLASGKVLIFSDSHIKFEPNWLEALLIRLISYESEEANPKLLILSPFISAFTEDDLEYPAAEYLRGGFNWDLSFTWEPMSDEEKDSLNTHGRLLNFTWLSLPRPTPVLAGSVIATLASPFKAFGAFDKNMSIWGGENIEISLRAWMCGGRVEIIPCSRVSHLFKSSHGYTFPDGKLSTIMRNLNRVATVWMQPSRSLQIKSVKYRVPPVALFYSAQQEALKVPAGNIISRQRVKQHLECKDFAWFVENVYPDLLRKAIEIKLKDNAMIQAQRSSIVSSLLDKSCGLFSFFT